MTGEEVRLAFDALAQGFGGLDAAAVSEVSHHDPGDERAGEDDESEVETEVLLESVHGLRGPCPFG